MICIMDVESAVVGVHMVHHMPWMNLRVLLDLRMAQKGREILMAELISTWSTTSSGGCSSGLVATASCRQHLSLTLVSTFDQMLVELWVALHPIKLLYPHVGVYTIITCDTRLNEV